MSISTGDITETFKGYKLQRFGPSWEVVDPEGHNVAMNIASRKKAQVFVNGTLARLVDVNPICVIVLEKSDQNVVYSISSIGGHFLSTNRAERRRTRKERQHNKRARARRNRLAAASSVATRTGARVGR